ncbi:hypothetical protein F4604DRAFT_1918541 [Suillus subluteus]|nr:hypothetical protein F4604DRAFT_1918541 [Suillus subluteus]
MYYIAGLTNTALPSSAQTVEGLAVFTTFRYLQYVISGIRAIAPVANAESGNIRTTPTSFIGKIIYLIHDIPFLIPPVTYILCVPFNRFVQPAWMQRMSLPNTYFKHESSLDAQLTHLGNQWHPIGRREKPRVVQTGPYAVVRHPAVHRSLLIQELLFTVMSWSYAPLVGLGIVAGAFAVKMPIEEDLIMQDPAIAVEYRAYMQKVPSRVIPFLW